MIDVSSNICTITNLWDIFATTYTEGDIDRKVKVGDVPNCAVKLQAGNIISSFKNTFYTKSQPYEHPKDCDQDGDHPHFLCTEEIQVAWRCPVSRHSMYK